MQTSDVQAGPDSTAPATRITVAGLFEDNIDAEEVLVALRKADHAADRVSLLVRDKTAEEENTADRTGAVARAVVASTLNAVGGWLQGLASLIVPERGTYLVAGPIGAALAGIRGTEARAGDPTGAVAYAAATDLSAGGLQRTLTEFGFNQEVATYLEHRLAAGTTLVAVTTNDRDALQSTRRVFADHNAVYIGLAQTDEEFFEEAEALLAAPPEVSSGGDVVVTDAVAPLVKVGKENGPAEMLKLCGRRVVDAGGEEVGAVEGMLAQEAAAAATGPTRLDIRYLVVGYGGLRGLGGRLGIGRGRHHVAVPADLADLATDPIRLTVDKEVLEHAPGYDDDAPFSRREEQTICAYFGCNPYWLATEGAPAAS